MEQRPGRGRGRLVLAISMGGWGEAVQILLLPLTGVWIHSFRSLPRTTSCALCTQEDTTPPKEF